MALTAEDFNYVRGFARTQSAIVLEPGKEYLVETRLAPVAQKEGFPSLSEFIAHLRSAPKPNGMHAKALDALTTNETYFFRDFHPFEALKKHVLPALINKRAPLRRLAIWSAAASTGQEAYSIAMILREHFPQLAGWNISIIGTDLSATVLNQARTGSYSQIEVNRGLPAPLLIKYFTKQDTRWVIKDDLRRMVDFREMNFVQAWPVMPAFDLILLRNVLIYFDIPTKQNILKKIRACLLPHGSLFLGSAETTLNIDPLWKTEAYGQTTVYQPLTEAKT